MFTEARLFLGMLTLTLALPAYAQTDPCAPTQAASFSPASRAWLLAHRYQILRRMHAEDLARSDRYFEARHGRPMSWRAGGAAFADSAFSYNHEVCTSQGQVEGTHHRIMVGGAVYFHHQPTGFGVEWFGLTVDDALKYTPPGAAPIGDDPEVESGTASATVNQGMMGARLSYRDYLAVTFGRTTFSKISTETGEDGLALNLAQPLEAPDSRAYFEVGVPMLDSYLEVQTKEGGLDLDWFTLETRHLGSADGEISGHGGVSYVEREGATFLTLGARLRRRLAPMLEIGVEIEDPRLRHGILRLEGDWGWGSLRRDMSEIRAHPERSSPLPFGFAVGGFTEITYFHSGELEHDLGEDATWGWGGGFYFQPELAYWMQRVEIHFGVDHPDLLTQDIDRRGHWQAGLRAHFRLGL